MATKTAMVLGGGTGGVVAARRLRQKLAREHRVVLVDRSDRHYFAPGFPWVMVGWRQPESTYRQLSALERKGIEFIQASVEEIDLEGRNVQLEGEAVSWDYLVVALGSEMAYDHTPGLEEMSHTYYSLDGAVELRETLRDFEGGTVAVVVAGLPYRCPAAPYEGALLIDQFFRKKGIRNRVNMKFFAPEPAPLPVAGPAVGEAVTGLLARQGVDYSPGMTLARVDGEKSELLFDDGSREGFDLLVTVPLHRVSAALNDSTLVGESGWVEVDRSTLATSAPDVFAIGDATLIKLASGLPLPKAGVFAHSQAEVVAFNIAAKAEEGDKSSRFDGHGSCFLETGDGKAAMASGNFYAEPMPEVRLRGPGLVWHWAKVLFQRWWFFRWL